MGSLHITSKDASHGSYTEPETAVSPKLFDDGISNVPTKYRGTDQDKLEMTALGKKQVLRVSAQLEVCLLQLMIDVAQLLFHNDAWICLHLCCQLGGRFNVCYSLLRCTSC